MPAEKLSDDPTTVRRFDVLVEIASDDFPVHVMLCNETQGRNDVKLGTALQVVDMGPPLDENTEDEYHAIGSAGLCDKQQQKIATFLTERFDEIKEFKARDLKGQYRIDPPVTKPSRDCSFWRFSCVGFVLAAYEEAEVTLVSAPYPLKDLDYLKKIYPMHSKRLDRPEFRTYMGIGTGTEWPVVLAGYVINALNRPVHEINGDKASPFKPEIGDEYFPHQRDRG